MKFLCPNCGSIKSNNKHSIGKKFLNGPYKNVDSGIEITDEEFSVLLNSSKDIEKEMNEIKEKWQQNDF